MIGPRCREHRCWFCRRSPFSGGAVASKALADLIELAIDQPKRYGAFDPQVVARLYRLLGEVGWRAGRKHRDTIDAQLIRLNAVVGAQDFDDHERSQLADLERHARNSAEGRWEPTR